MAIAQQTEPTTKRRTKTTTGIAGGRYASSGEKGGNKEPEERIKGTTVTFTKKRSSLPTRTRRDLFRELQARRKTTPVQIDDQQGRRVGPEGETTAG